MTTGFWTNKERALLERLYMEGGKTCEECSQILGRPYSSVRAHIASFGLTRRRAREAKQKSPPPAIATIAQSNVPAWYALGWRFDRFATGGLCIMYWPDSRKPRIPSFDDVIIPASRELEAA